jgi:ceramide glucosyltransferase
MSLLLQALFWIAAIGTVTSSIYCLMVVAAALRFGLRRRREDQAPADFLPPISVFKPMHGTEPGMEQNLTTFFEQDYPEFELLFCARHATDPGLTLARAVAARYPHVNARFLTCGEPTPDFPNAKVFSFAKLDAEAQYECVVTSDADVRVAPDYLRRAIQNLREPEMGLASCLYIGTVATEDDGKPRLTSQLDAVGKSVEMSSGVLVADMLEGTKFALGPTMILRRNSFQLAGGFRELASFMAEDFVLGNRLASQGAGVRMATHVIRLMVRDQPFATSFKDQLRWMQSTRRSRPWGHLGTGLTFALPFGLVGLLWGLLSGHPAVGALWLLASIANRWLQAATVLLVLGDPEWFRNSLIYPLRDLLGSIVWLGSYGSSRFYYRGAIRVLDAAGTFDTSK